jgi:hypothetical protein
MARSKNNKFSDEAIRNIAGLFDTLKKIHIRLMNEGWGYKDGKLIPPKNNFENK